MTSPFSYASTTACTRSRRSAWSGSPTWVLTVPSESTSRAAISPFDCPGEQQHLALAVGQLAQPGSSRRRRWRRAARAKRGDQPAGRDGARTASPPSTARTRRESRGGASLSRKPLAPALSAAKTYSSRSNVVRIEHLRRGPALADPPGGLHAVDARHTYVHEHDVGSQRGGPSTASTPSPASPRPRCRPGLPGSCGSRAHQHLVVDEQHADIGSARQRSRGRAKPRSGRGAAVSVPPNATGTLAHAERGRGPPACRPSRGPRPSSRDARARARRRRSAGATSTADAPARA